MSQPALLPIHWKPREFALLPSAVAASGKCAVRLAQRLLEKSDDELAQLEGVAGQGLIVLQGKADLLPWAPGVQYLGFTGSSTAVLFPTNRAPSVPEALLATFLSEKSGGVGIIAVLPHPLLVVPMAAARPISRLAVAGWLERNGHEAS